MPSSLFLRDPIRKLLKAKSRLSKQKNQNDFQLKVSTKKAKKLYDRINRLRLDREKSRNWKLADYTNTNEAFKSRLESNRNAFRKRNHSQNVLRSYKKTMNSLDELAKEADKKLDDLKSILQLRVCCC